MVLNMIFISLSKYVTHLILPQGRNVKYVCVHSGKSWMEYKKTQQNQTYSVCGFKHLWIHFDSIDISFPNSIKVW